MTKNIKIVLLLLFALGAGTALYFTPHLTLHNIKKAVDKKDAVALSDYVDYPALRENLKASINAKMAGELMREKDDNPFKALGAALAAVFLDKMIDAFITPESLSMMMKGQKPQIEKTKGEKEAKSPSEEPDIETSTSYETLNRFVVKIKEKRSSDPPVEFVFKRDGIFSWKLSAVRLPW